jgi:hypothetical protein
VCWRRGSRRPTPPEPTTGLVPWPPPPKPERVLPPSPPGPDTDVPVPPTPPQPATDVATRPSLPPTPAPGTAGTRSAVERKRAEVATAWDEFQKALRARVVVGPPCREAAGRAEWWLAWQDGWRATWQAREQDADVEDLTEIEHLLSAWAQRAWWWVTYPDEEGVRTFMLLVNTTESGPRPRDRQCPGIESGRAAVGIILPAAGGR